MRAKIGSFAGILFSVAVLVALTPQGSTVLYVYSAINTVAILFIATRRSTIPEPATAEVTPEDAALEGAQAA